jgi:hygromycin-B 7''-O-kinase
MTALPAQIDVAAFDALQQDVERWRGVVTGLARRHGAADVRPVASGTVLVALVGDTQVVKLYPPFLRDHFEFERAALEVLHGRLSVPTPRLLASGEHADGWPYLLMTQLAGTPLAEVWDSLDETRRCTLLRAIGRVAAEAHAIDPAPLRPVALAWPAFLEGQRQRCRRRQERTGLPPHLLARLEAFVDGGDVPPGPDVVLTGEYTPHNLMYRPVPGASGLVGMFDFGDGLVGPREYDWLGPLCFFAAGDASRVDALMDGLGAPRGRAWRLPLLRLLLLHRYSHLKIQIARPGWQEAPDFETLAAWIWP